MYNGSKRPIASSWEKACPGAEHNMLDPRHPWYFDLIGSFAISLLNSVIWSHIVGSFTTNTITLLAVVFVVCTSTMTSLILVSAGSRR